MTSNFSPDIVAKKTTEPQDERLQGADQLHDDDLEIIEMRDDDDASSSDAADVRSSTEKAEKPNQTGEQEEEEEEKFWESLPVIDSRPLKKKKKKTRQAQ